MKPSLDLKVTSRSVRIALLGTLLVSAIATGAAQVRQSFTYSTFVNSHAAPATIRAFRSGGFFAIAGGVVFQGSSSFYLESVSGKQKVSAENVSLTSSANGNVYLNVASEAYRLEIHRGLACPLGRFVEREATIAYTVPPATFLKHHYTDAELRRQQSQFDQEGVVLVEVQSGELMGFAKEFVKTPFLQLLYKADFADVVSLPPAIRTSLMMNVNQGVSAGQAQGHGTYINSDSQTVYQAHLMQTTRRVETEGVPLRFYWSFASGGARVTDVVALSQSWPAGTKLTNFNVKGAKPSEYDIISLFQNAGIFRELRRANSASFDHFVESACGN
jgi:hypothetical protein